MSILKVLIATDDPLVGIGLEAQLTNLGHAVVSTEGTGSAVVRSIQVHRPDLIILDSQVLKISEPVLGPVIRGKNRPWLPVILLTDRPEDRLAQPDQVGTVVYLVKPADEQDLAQAVSTLSTSA